jgi:hypothetical protein
MPVPMLVRTAALGQGPHVAEEGWAGRVPSPGEEGS